jgi:hypothetical protein
LTLGLFAGSALIVSANCSAARSSGTELPTRALYDAVTLVGLLTTWR